IFGDVLAVALMKHKQFSLEEYAKNHPAGSIGKRITQTVDQVMIEGKDLPLCDPDDKLKDVLVELTNKKCGCLLVVDKAKYLHGIFTDGDLRRALQEKPHSVLEENMKNLMTKSFLFIEKKRLAHEAIQLMQKDPKKWVMMLP